MPFGLKNARAPYQRLVNKIFDELIGTSMEVYVDDMLVKSKTANDHLHNLSLMFVILKKYNMHLNPNKCRRQKRTFRASSGELPPWPNSYLKPPIGASPSLKPSRAASDR
ncbi:unnamed protein product [Prunus brigantina]